MEIISKENARIITKNAKDALCNSTLDMINREIREAAELGKYAVFVTLPNFELLEIFNKKLSEMVYRVTKYVISNQLQICW